MKRKTCGPPHPTPSGKNKYCMSQDYFRFFTGHSGGDYTSPDGSGKGKLHPLEPESIVLTHYTKTVF
jgi:hypothetical protein